MAQHRTRPTVTSAKTGAAKLLDTPRPPKRHLDALEKVFHAEIEARLPFQSKARVFQELADLGLLESMERKFGTGWTGITVTGWQLTHAGRFLYCSSC
jgi:hypothetical protein